MASGWAASRKRWEPRKRPLVEPRYCIEPQSTRCPFAVFARLAVKWLGCRPGIRAVTSLYVHIPFCERKCLYCDFYSVEGTGRVESFLAALAREIALRGEGADRATFETVFFGGGTPSL